jgi:hypothetical protein
MSAWRRADAQSLALMSPKRISGSAQAADDAIRRLLGVCRFALDPAEERFRCRRFSRRGAVTLDRGNVTEALSAATELQLVGLVEALELTLLLAGAEPAKFERAARRRHARFVREVPKVDLRESQAVLALLAAIPVNRLAAEALAELVVTGRGPEPVAEALVRWTRAPQ